MRADQSWPFQISSFSFVSVAACLGRPARPLSFCFQNGATPLHALFNNPNNDDVLFADEVATLLIEAGVETDAQRRRVRSAALSALSALTSFPHALPLVRKNTICTCCGHQSSPAARCARAQDGKTALHLALASDVKYVLDAAEHLIRDHNADQLLADNVRLHPMLSRSCLFFGFALDPLREGQQRTSERISWAPAVLKFGQTRRMLSL